MHTTREPDLAGIRDEERLVDPRAVPAAAAHGAPGAANPQPRVSMIPRLRAVPIGSPDFNSITLRLRENRDWMKPAETHKLKDYVGMAFELVEAQRVDYGPTLKEFDAHAEQIRRKGESAALKVVFHGCHLLNGPHAARFAKSLAQKGLVPSGLAGAVMTDRGWFGDGARGVYVAKHMDYCLKFANAERLQQPVKVGETVKVLMLKLLPGRVKQLQQAAQGTPPPPTPGFDCHQSSGHEQELYVYDQTATDPDAPARGPRQLLLTHFLTIKVVAEVEDFVEGDDT